MRFAFGETANGTSRGIFGHLKARGREKKKREDPPSLSPTLFCYFSFSFSRVDDASECGMYRGVCENRGIREAQ
jgi:hypothetical protein